MTYLIYFCIAFTAYRAVRTTLAAVRWWRTNNGPSILSTGSLQRLRQR